MKGIIGGVENESGYCNTIDHMRGGGAVVIIVSAGKAAIERGDAVVKLAQAANAAQARSVERAWKQAGFGAQPPAQVPQEI